VLDKKLQAFERRNPFLFLFLIPYLLQKNKRSQFHMSVHVFRSTYFEAIFVKQPLRVTCSIDQVFRSFRFVRKFVRFLRICDHAKAGATAPENKMFGVKSATIQVRSV
jgi:hypothetical protein